MNRNKLLILSTVLFGAIGTQTAMAQAGVSPSDQQQLPGTATQVDRKDTLPNSSEQLQPQAQEGQIVGYRTKAVRDHSPQSQEEVAADAYRSSGNNSLPDRL